MYNEKCIFMFGFAKHLTVLLLNYVFLNMLLLIILSVLKKAN